MKRKTGPEQSQNPRRHPRQDPVSCESCRKKKLKCDRQQPCGSCLTRRLTCSFLSTPIELKPESLVPKVSPGTQEIPLAFSASGRGTRDSRESLLTADWLEQIHMGDRVPAALTPQFRAGLYHKPLDVDESAGPARILCSIQGNGISLATNPATVDLMQFLPAETDAVALFTYYCRHVSYTYHIIIPHTVERQINEVYRCVERGERVNANYLALLFAIVGCSLFLQSSIESSVYAARCSRQFSFLTGAALTQANYGSYPTIEGLQAVLIIFHNISNVHCCTSVSTFFTVGSIVDQAKNMMLHLLDTPRAREERKTRPVPVMELELKRRLWWDIASFDWCLGFLSGPQEWTYLVNPSFMKTDKPLNIDDADIESGLSHPSTTPTSMSYFLERLKVAEACRCIVDAMSAEQLTGTEVEYSKILELDHKLRQAQVDAPDFFRLASTSRKRFASLYEQRPTLAWQRCLLQQAYYSRLCRLHRPFLIRGARDPAFSYSYMTVLSSARKVLEIKRILDEEEPRCAPSSSSIWCVMHQVFMAAVMLLLDACYNRDDVLDEKRKEEVLDACRMLRKAEQSSALVKEGINAMMGVLQRHHKGENSVPAASNLAAGVGALDSHRLVPVAVSEGAQYDQGANNIEAPADDLRVLPDKELEEIWSELIDNGGNIDFATEDWSGLFTDLHSLRDEL
ncbi:Zn(II)2Cys6 transcription factor [Aspergillus undulatus]|uniref:Zn(II)2Cys6 transcription factor n=1 Tax=Aspergillus undulatus TaxID=1810928 RepID=UPI003CCD263B